MQYTCLLGYNPNGEILHVNWTRTKHNISQAATLGCPSRTKFWSSDFCFAPKLRMYCIDTDALVFIFNGGSPYGFTILKWEDSENFFLTCIGHDLGWVNWCNQPWGPTWLDILVFCLKVGYFDFVKNILNHTALKKMQWSVWDEDQRWGELSFLRVITCDCASSYNTTSLWVTKHPWGPSWPCSWCFLDVFTTEMEIYFCQLFLYHQSSYMFINSLWIASC